MSEAFSNELERATARSDVEEIRRANRDAHQYLALKKENPEKAKKREYLVFEDVYYDRSDLDRLLAIAVLAMSEFDDPEFIGLVAAGPLEDIFFDKNDVPEELIQRIEDEARKTARFRWMLSGVWTNSFRPEHAKRIEAAVAGANMDTDPLPARPWA